MRIQLRIIYILALCVLSNFHLLAQRWKWQNPKPEGDYFNGLSFITRGQGWIVGNAGVILHTTDSGNTWTFQHGNSCADMLCIQFVGTSEGWIGGSSGTILHTTNAGKTWQPQNSGITSDVHSVSFINNSEGWMLSGSGVLHTINGGNSWSLLSSPVSGFCIKFTDPMSGWVGSNFGKIYHTSDGGKKWSTQVSGVTENLLSVSAINGSEAWMAGVPGIIHTSDSGKTWSSQTGNCCKFYKSVHFINSRVGWAIGENVLLRTENGGKAWTADTFESTFDKIQLTDSTHAWIIGPANIISTPSGGLLANKVSTVGNSNLNSIHFSNNSVGWTVGSVGNILKTSDGGKIWKPQESNVYFDLTSVYGINSNEAWITGLAPDTILHTSNGGDSWEVQDSKTPNALNSVFFVNSSTGWAVGYNGTIMHTSNGGTNWVAQISNTSATLHSICFAGPDSGWAAGDGGTIVYTSNGGQSWAVQTSGTALDLNCIQFISHRQGWAAGYAGSILRTLDGGAKWTVGQVPGAGFPITGLCFADSRFGWVTSAFPSISYTNDSGKTWTPEPCVPQFSAQSVQVVDTSEGWVAGAYGSILHFSTGGGQTSLPGSTFSDPTLLIYPNPFHVSCIISIGMELENASIVIYNTLGQTVKYIPSVSKKDITIYRDDLPDGIYFYCIIKDQQTLYSGKIAVE